MEMKKTFSFDLEIQVERINGYYVAMTTPFALTAYGDTEEQAEKRAVDAVDLLLNNHIQELERRGVKFSIKKDDVTQEAMDILYSELPNFINKQNEYSKGWNDFRVDILDILSRINRQSKEAQDES